MADDKKEKQGFIPTRHMAKLHLEIDPDALRRVVADGRVMELAHTLGKEASAQISSQIVEHLAEAAVGGNLATSALTVTAHFIFEGGDYGTVPPRPRWTIASTEALGGGLLQQLAATEMVH